MKFKVRKADLFKAYKWKIEAHSDWVFVPDFIELEGEPIDEPKQIEPLNEKKCALCGGRDWLTAPFPRPHGIDCFRCRLKWCDFDWANDPERDFYRLQSKLNELIAVVNRLTKLR